MMHLFRLLASWSARHLLVFILVVAAMVGFVKAKEAYDRLPAAQAELHALERQQALLQSESGDLLAQARGSLAEIGAMERPMLLRRLAQVRAEIAPLAERDLSRAGFALDVVQGDSGAIAGSLVDSLRLKLLRQEEAAILARLRMIDQGVRAQGLIPHAHALDARIAALERRIAEIERLHPLLARTENVPVIRNLVGPWQELRARRQALAAARAQRERMVRAQRLAAASYRTARAAYGEAAAAIRSAAPATAALEQRIDESREALSQHWANRLWEAVRPVLGWALWVMLLVIVVPPITKAFWFFIVAPVAARLAPLRLCPEAGGEADWASERVVNRRGGAGSAVSCQLTLEPGEELLVRSEYLQSSVNDARIDSQLLLSWAIPLGSLATGLVGLTRIRVDRPTVIALAASQDVLDEVGVIEIAAGSAMVFKPRSLVGVLQPIDRPMRIQRLWTLDHLSAWLTLQLRHLVFHGPCVLVVKGARGVALDPAEGGRRIAGAATLGWSAGLGYSVRRSETFLAYLTGKQSLFNDSFEGPHGKVAYEELPRARDRAGLFGRGLEGLGDALMKIVGL